MDIRYIDSELFGVDLERRLDNGMTLTARAGFNEVDHLMDNFSLRTPPATPMRNRQNLTYGRGAMFDLSADWSGDEYSLVGGIDGRYANHDSRISNPANANFFIQNFNDIRRDVTSAFGIVRRNGADSDWELGLRYTHVAANADPVSFGGMMGMMATQAGMLADAFNTSDRSRQFDSVDIVAKYVRPLGDTLSLGIDVGSKARAPSYQELYLWLPLQATGGLADGRSYVGNLDLDVERSNEITLGLEWATSRFGFSPQVFYRRVDDYIQGVPAASTAANALATMMTGSAALMFDNVDAEIYGFDAGWRYALTEVVAFSGSASYTRGRRTDVDDNLYRLPPPNAMLALDATLQGWAARAEVVAYARQDKVSAFNEEMETPGYAVVNAQVSWQPVPSWRVDFRATNLFDRGYQDHLAGINRVRDVDIPVGERLYGAGRSFTVGAVFSF